MRAVHFSQRRRRGGDAFAARFIHIGDGDLGAFGREKFCDFLADVAAGAGDDCDLTF